MNAAFIYSQPIHGVFLYPGRSRPSNKVNKVNVSRFTASGRLYFLYLDNALYKTCYQVQVRFISLLRVPDDHGLHQRTDLSALSNVPREGGRIKLGRRVERRDQP